MLTTGTFDNKPFNKIIAHWRKKIERKLGNIFYSVAKARLTPTEKETDRLQWEIDRLQHENKILVIALAEKEKLITIAQKAAHDISSPLNALAIMIRLCDEVEQDKRSIINKATKSILDIADTLLSTYRNQHHYTTPSVEKRQPILISEAITQLLSEKKAQYHHKIHFEIHIASDAQFTFAKVQPSQFRRSLSNLINNAVDALDNGNNSLVTINLAANEQTLTVTIQDNGKGMTPSMVAKMQNRQSFTAGKENGHGLGLQQVWDTLEYNQGVMKVQSILGQGTLIQLSFPQIITPN